MLDVISKNKKNIKIEFLGIENLSKKQQKNKQKKLVMLIIILEFFNLLTGL